jgi:hypothetical protein
MMFDIDLCILSISEWQSDNSIYGDSLLSDAIAKTGFKSGETIINGQVIDVLIAFTGQYLGCAGGAWVSKRAIIMQYNAYWADDNILRHEVSHLFKTEDHVDRAIHISLMIV